MNCPDDNRLVEFVAELLPADAQRDVDQHVDGCARCRELLAVFARGTTLSSGSGAGSVSTAVPEPAAAIADRYVVLDVLGTGGMAVVYAAYDRELDRKVAVKVLRDVADDPHTGPERTARLRREAQAMARLAHPNVLPVYDVGTFDGRVFLTAELVAGTTLAGWLAGADRSWRDIVGVFVQAGRGLAAAHAAGITHRDFKPSNVLVGDDGRVRVADFGLARTAVVTPVSVASSDGTPATAVEAASGPVSGPGFDVGSTRTGQLLGTPAYMAPEQLAGAADVDARSDQYSFCVSLFEALYGERPFRATSVEALAVAMAGPLPAGTRVLPGAVERAIRPVLARGLARAPADRHAAMTDVVAALEAMLGRRRWRWAYAAAAAVVLAAAAGFAIRAAASDDDPCAAAGGSLAGAWDAPGRAALRAGFAASGHADAAAIATRTEAELDGYATRWTAMRRDACRATHVRHDQSPAVLDLRTRCLDVRRAELAAVVGALRQPDRPQVSRAVATARSLTALDGCADVAALTAPIAPPADPAVRTRVDDIRERLGRATGLERAGRYRDADALAVAAAADAMVTGYEPVIAETLYRRGQLEGSIGKNQEAVKTLEAAVHHAALAHDDVLAARAWTGQVEIVGFRLARHEDGLILARAAEAAVLRAGDPPEIAADLHQMRGLILRELARYDDATAEVEQELALRRRAFPPDDPRVAQAVHDLAELERVTGKLTEARAHHEEALASRIRSLGPDHPLVGGSHINLGHVFYALGDNPHAREHYEAALAIDERALPPDHIEIGNALTSMGVVELAEGDDGAIAMFERAGAIYRKALGDQHPLVAMIENNLGEAERRHERYAEAKAHFERALAIKLATGPREHPAVATTLNNLGDILRLSGDRAGAKARYDEALAIFTKVLGPDGDMVAYPHIGLGQLALASDPAAAATHFARALAIREQGDAAPYELAEARDGLARALARTHGDPKRIRDLATAALADYAKSGGEAESIALRAFLGTGR